jgi:hypothetical protein
MTKMGTDWPVNAVLRAESLVPARGSPYPHIMALLRRPDGELSFVKSVDNSGRRLPHPRRIGPSAHTTAARLLEPNSVIGERPLRLPHGLEAAAPRRMRDRQAQTLNVGR